MKKPLMCITKKPPTHKTANRIANRRNIVRLSFQEIDIVLQPHHEKLNAFFALLRVQNFSQFGVDNI
jgi:hypothetical protein